MRRTRVITRNMVVSTDRVLGNSAKCKVQSEKCKLNGIQHFALCTAFEQSRPIRSHAPRGVSLLIVIIALGLASALGMSLIKLCLIQSRHIQRATFANQSRLLVEAGVDRAVAELKLDPTFKGTTWKLKPEELDGRHPALVSIEIKPVENEPKQRQIVVTADYPVEPSLRSRVSVTRQFIP